ncbi:Sec-independent protein translocase protein TatB [Chloroflexota bacterium]
MDFFGIGAGEVILILIVALVVWGPKRLPEIARTLGRMTRGLRKATYDLTSQVTKEIDLQETDSKEKDTPPQPRQDSDHKPKNS